MSEANVGSSVEQNIEPNIEANSEPNSEAHIEMDAEGKGEANAEAEAEAEVEMNAGMARSPGGRAESAAHGAGAAHYTHGPAREAEWDVVVVGAGAAGLNAALVLARARRRVAVIDGGAPRNAPADRMHGFLSRDGMPPAALLEVGRTELAAYGAELINGRAAEITPDLGVRLAGGPELRARRVLVATGLRDELPDLPGLRERWGRDLLHCPYCHGYEVRDRPLGVLGSHPGSVHQALLLRQWSDDVVLFPHQLDPSDEERERLAARGVRIAEGTVKRLVVDDDRLRGVELAEGHVVPRAAVFVFPRMVPHDTLLTALGCARNEDGWVRTDPSGRTSVPGVWAAGNVADPRAQVVTAAGMGAAAAFALNLDLVEEDVERAVAERRATVGAHR